MDAVEDFIDVGNILDRSWYFFVQYLMILNIPSQGRIDKAIPIFLIFHSFYYRTSVGRVKLGSYC